LPFLGNVLLVSSSGVLLFSPKGMAGAAWAMIDENFSFFLCEPLNFLKE
jgi:hypothetical protein